MAIKKFGLAALLALAALALIGTSSAMAESTVLCSADEDPCEPTNVVTHVHDTSVGKAKLLTSIGNVECDALFLGDTVKGTTAPLTIKGNFTYSTCKRSTESCTVTEENGPAEVEVSKEGHETASETGENLVHIKCGSFINCNYISKGLKATVKGPLLSTQENGEASISEQTVTKESGLLCPKTAKLDITTTPLVATYMVSSVAAQEWLVEDQMLLELKLKEETFEVSSKTSTVLSVPGLELVLKCKTTAGSGKILVKAGTEISLSLTGCEAVGFPKCTVKEPVAITAKTKVSATASAFLEGFEQPGKETPLAIVKFSGECPLPEESELKGTIAGELPAEAAVERVVKVSEALTKKVNEELKAEERSEYSLLYGSKSATLSGDFAMKLSGGKGAGKAFQVQPIAVLCKAEPVGAMRECPEGESYPNGTVVKPETLEGEKVKWAFELENNNKNIVCDALKMEGPITSRETSVAVSINSVSFGATCTGGCVVSALNLPWRAHFLLIPSPDFYIPIPGFEFDCGMGKICKYWAISIFATTPPGVEGGSPAKFEFPASSLGRLSNAETTCSAAASWENAASGSLRYKFWEPAPLEVAWE